MSDDWGNDPVVQGAPPATAPASGGWGDDPVVGAKNFKFSDSAITAAQKKPNTVTIYMKPDQYLAMTPEFDGSPRSDRKGKSLQKSLDKGDDVNEIPSLDVSVDKDGTAKVHDQDGRHRAQFAKDAGVDLIPVAIHRTDGKGLIKSLHGMRDGSEPVPFDFKPVLPPQAPAKADKPLPRWDVLGDIGRDAEAAVGAVKQDIAKADPLGSERRAQVANDTAKYGPALATVKDETVGTLGRMGNALKAPLDALAVPGSLLTGTAKALGGSALATVTPPVSVGPGGKLSPADPKAVADANVGQALGLIAPESMGPNAAAITSASKAASTAAQTNNALLKAQNLRPEAMQAHEAGYVLPPTMAKIKPGAVDSLASGVGGKIKLQQGASVRNQETTNGLAAESLGLPRDTTLTDQVFRQVRAKASQAYKAVANSVPEVTVDPQYQQNIASLGGRNSAAGQQFPGVMKNDELDTFIKNVGSVQKFTPDAGLEVVRKLRKDAVGNLKALGDPNKTALGLAQRAAADEIDELIERNLTAAGKSDLVKDYRAARQLLAKSHDVQGATNTATGDVSAIGLGRLAAKGKPLTGQLRTIADTANAFPKAMQNPERFGGDEPYSALDAGATAFAAAHGDYSAVGTILGRPIVRNALLSKGWQNRMIPDLANLPSIPPPSSGVQLLHNLPLPGVQNQLARGIFRAAHVNGLRALTMPQATATPPTQGQ